MGWPRQLPGNRNSTPGEKEKVCSRCGRKFSKFKIKKRRGKMVKVCPYCGK